MGWIIRSGHRLDGSPGRSGEENDNFYENNALFLVFPSCLCLLESPHGVAVVAILDDGTYAARSASYRCTWYMIVYTPFTFKSIVPVNGKMMCPFLCTSYYVCTLPFCLRWARWRNQSCIGLPAG